MASNKEVLEAQRYGRRRLLAAFTAGLPDGRETKLPGTTVPIIVGAVLAVALIIVAAVLGKLSPSLGNDWENNTLFVVKSTGARYLTIDGVLRPITNRTSAQLLTESGSLTTKDVDVSLLEGIDRGSPIGIVDAPELITPTAPDTDGGASKTWTSCALGAGDTSLWIGGEPEELNEAGAALVSNDDQYYLVAQGHHHLLNPDNRENIRIALGMESTPIFPVSAAWLNLSEKGEDLHAVEVENAGSPVQGLPRALGSASLGSVIQIKSDTEIVRRYIVTGDAQIAPLSDFGFALYQIGQGAQKTTTLDAEVKDLTNLEVVASSIIPATWPDGLVSAIETETVPCLQLNPSVSVQNQADGLTLYALTTKDEEEDAENTENGGNTGNGDQTGATANTKTGAEQNADEQTVNNSVEVEGGVTLLVKAVSPGAQVGSVTLVTDEGKRSSLGDNEADSLSKLGLENAKQVTVPTFWVELLPQGPELSSTAAWQTVAAR